MSEAIGKETATGLDVLLDALTQAVPQVARYLLLTIFLLCEDNGSLPAFFISNNENLKIVK